MVAQISSTDDQQFQLLLYRLKDFDSSARYFAARDLGELGDRRAYDALVPLIFDRGSGVADQAIVALLKIDRTAATALLVKLLNDDNKGFVAHIVYSIPRDDLPPLDAALIPQLVDALIRVLQDEDSPARSHAANLLNWLHDHRAVPALVATLKDEDDTIRDDVALALGDIGDARAFIALIDALEGEIARPPDEWRIIDIAQALGKIDGEQAYNLFGERMIAQLSSDNASGRADAAAILAGFGDSRALEALAQRVRDADHWVRLRACAGIVRFGAAGTELLIQLLKDENLEVRSQAATALGQSRDERAVAALLAVLDDMAVRTMALAALAEVDASSLDQWMAKKLQISRPDDRLTLLDNLETLGRSVGLQKLPATITALIALLQSDEEDTQLRVAQLIGELGQKIGDRHIIPPLLRMLDGSNPNLRCAAFNALLPVGFQPSFEQLATLFDAGDKCLRTETILALGALGDRRATALLIPLLEDCDEFVRYRALMALGQLGDQQAVEPVIALLNDSSPNVLYQAVHTLGRLADKRALPALRQLVDSSELPIWRYLGSVGDQARAAIKHIERIGSLDQKGAHHRCAPNSNLKPQTSALS